MARPKITVTAISNSKQGLPCVLADPLPAVGKGVEFTIEGQTYRGTPTEHAEVKGVKMAVFGDGLTPV